MGRNWTAVGGALLGGWLLVAPFAVFEAMLAPNFWADVVVGVTVLFVAAYAGVRSWRGGVPNVAAGGLLGLLGLFQLTRPLVVGTAGPLPLWSDLAVGLALSFLGGRTVRTARAPTSERLGGERTDRR